MAHLFLRFSHVGTIYKCTIYINTIYYIIIILFSCALFGIILIKFLKKVENYNFFHFEFFAKVVASPF